MDHHGQLISLHETTGSNMNVIGRDGVKNVLHSLFENVQLDGRKLIDILPQCKVVAGMSGLALPQNKQNLREIFEEFGAKKENLSLMADVELVLQLINDQGIVLIAGSGSICFGKTKDSTYRVGGLGPILGDKGSGYKIGLYAIQHALAEEYGWGKPTHLTGSMRHFFNVEDLKSLIPKINSLQMKPAKIATVAPLVFEEAFNGDPIAEEIIDTAAQELAELLTSQIALSQLSACEIHLWGGIFKNTHADQFIQKIIQNAGLQKFTIRNRSFENPTVTYARKFI